MNPLKSQIIRTVLVVEDDTLLRLIMREALVDEGYAVVEAENGDAAMRILLSSATDIHALLTDVQMPGQLGGIGLAHQTAKQWPHIHLMVASGYGLLVTKELPPECRVFSKPYMFSDLVSHLRQLVSAEL